MKHPECLFSHRFCETPAGRRVFPNPLLSDRLRMARIRGHPSQNNWLSFRKDVTELEVVPSRDFVCCGVNIFHRKRSEAPPSRMGVRIKMASPTCRDLRHSSSPSQWRSEMIKRARSRRPSYTGLHCRAHLVSISFRCPTR